MSTCPHIMDNNRLAPLDVASNDNQSETVAALQARLWELSTVEREREIALEAARQAEARARHAEVERDEAMTELTRVTAAYEDRKQEANELRAYQNTVRQICALPHDKFGPYDKLAWITAPEQRPYSASRHNGPQDIKVTSYGDWTKSIGGSKGAITRAAERLEAAGAIKRQEVECGDRHTHYTQEVNLELWRNPRMSAPVEERKNNGGSKRCPQCGGYCKKHLKVVYECEKCGIDFDSDMNPIEHEEQPAPAPAVSEPAPVPTPAFIQPELTVQPPPLQMIPRPFACFCGVRSYWFMDGSQSHCEHCEPFYVKRQA